MKIRKQTDSPKQYEVVDDDDSILGCHNTEDVATIEMEKVKAAKANKGRSQEAKEAKS